MAASGRVSESGADLAAPLASGPHPGRGPRLPDLLTAPMVGGAIVAATLYNFFVAVRQVGPGPLEVALNVALVVAIAATVLLPRSRTAWWFAQGMALAFIVGTVLINYRVGGAPERTLLWMPWLAIVYLHNAGSLAPRAALFASGAIFLGSLGLIAFFAVVGYIAPGMAVFDALAIMALFHATLILMLFNVARRNAFEIAWRARAEAALENAKTQARAEADLAAARLALAEERRSLSVSALAESIAHEIRQPLTSIATGATAALNWLRHDPPDAAEAAACSERILAAARRAGEIVSATRGLIRREERPRAVIDAGAMIVDVASVLHEEAGDDGVTLTVRRGPGVLTVLADPAQLRQLLVNLAKNAIEASVGVEDPIVMLSAEVQRGHVVLAVEDRGVGFTEEGHARAFEAFYSTKAGGMGLGLAIARTVAETHGGRIAAMALPRGARVTVTLPVAIP